MKRRRGFCFALRTFHESCAFKVELFASGELGGVHDADLVILVEGDLHFVFESHLFFRFVVSGRKNDEEHSTTGR
jgi:hypothetical protein